MNETYRKVLQIFVMKNYAVTFNMCYIGCDWHNFNMAMGQKRCKSLHGCFFAMKHFFEKSLESLALFHVLCCKKCLRRFKIMQLQRLGVNAQTDTQTHKLIATRGQQQAEISYTMEEISRNMTGVWRGV